MRYLDPEAVARTVPNYQPRAPDTRPHRGPPRTADSGDKWQRGPDVGRPSFDKSALDRDLDRYGTKRQKEGESIREKGRDYDDWRALRRRSRSRSRSPVMGRERRRNGSPEQRSNSPRHRTRSAEPGHRKDRSPERGKRKERSPLMRPDSPLRGDRSDGSGSDMVIEEDD